MVCLLLINDAIFAVPKRNQMREGAPLSEFNTWKEQEIARKALEAPAEDAIDPGSESEAPGDGTATDTSSKA
jgi:hypothetical protein